VSQQQYDKLGKLAREIIDAFRDDRDADVSNLIDAGLHIDAKGLAYALARHAAALRFIAPDGQAFYAQRDGEWFGFWPDGQPDRWESSERKFVVPTLGSTLGYELAREEPPEWLEPLAQRVLADLGVTD
jgi:hypothetical protein